MNTTKQDKVDFLDIDVSEMKNSIAISEAYLRAFRINGKCHWALASNLDNIVEFEITLAIARRLRNAIENNPPIRKEYSNYRNLALVALTEYPNYNKSVKVSIKNEFVNFLNCTPAVKELMSGFFIPSELTWVCKRTRRGILNGYLSKKISEVEDIPLVYTDLKQILRIIIRTLNCLSFMYPKSIKGICVSPLSNIGDILKTATSDILNLPRVYFPQILVTDGSRLDIYVRDTAKGENSWISEIRNLAPLPKGDLRAFTISRVEDNIAFREVYDIAPIVKTFPKKKMPSYKEIMDAEEDANIQAEVRHKSVDEQLRELFSKMR